jgi:hypothetical protein
VGLRAALVDKSNKVIIDSAETAEGAGVRQGAVRHLPARHLSWLDPNNNKAFLDSQISGDQQRHLDLLRRQEFDRPQGQGPGGKDIQHANFPVGPVGKPTEYHLFFNQMVFKHTKFPKAAKEFVRFMMEEEQFNPWMQAAGGYISQPLRAYEKNPVWTVDPKHTPYRDCVKNMRPAGFQGRWATPRPARWPTSSCRTWWPRPSAARRRRRKRRSARNSAPSATTRSAASPAAQRRAGCCAPCRTAATCSGCYSCCPRQCCCCCS